MTLSEIIKVLAPFDLIGVINQKGELIYYGQVNLCPLRSYELLSIHKDKMQRLILKVDTNENKI